MRHDIDSFFDVIIPLLCLLLMAVVIGVFVLRKHKAWHNYVAFAGELLFIMCILWRFQQYRFYTIIAFASGMLLMVAIAGNAIVLKMKKVSYGSTLGVRLGVYAFMLIAICVLGAEGRNTGTAVGADSVYKIKPTGKVFNMHSSVPITDDKTKSNAK